MTSMNVNSTPIPPNHGETEDKKDSAPSKSDKRSSINGRDSTVIKEESPSPVSRLGKETLQNNEPTAQHPHQPIKAKRQGVKMNATELKAQFSEQESAEIQKKRQEALPEIKEKVGAMNRSDVEQKLQAMLPKSGHGLPVNYGVLRYSENDKNFVLSSASFGNKISHRRLSEEQINILLDKGIGAFVKSEISKYEDENGQPFELSLANTKSQQELNQSSIPEMERGEAEQKLKNSLASGKISVGPNSFIVRRSKDPVSPFKFDFNVTVMIKEGKFEHRALSGSHVKLLAEKGPEALNTSLRNEFQREIEREFNKLRVPEMNQKQAEAELTDKPAGFKSFVVYRSPSSFSGFFVSVKLREGESIKHIPLSPAEVNLLADKGPIELNRALKNRFLTERAKPAPKESRSGPEQSSGTNVPPAKAKENIPSSFAILGLPVTATASEIKKAYNKLILSNHPDKVTQRGGTEEEIKAAVIKFRIINEAYESLYEKAKLKEKTA
jgi:hypothetical protein